jgi:hypothetical protein
MLGSEAGRSYLSDEFLDRARRAYRSAVTTTSKVHGMWRDIDARRVDIHAALLAESNGALRAMFADPVSTDLYYGVDNLCRSIVGAIEPSSFLTQALASERAGLAIYQVQRLQELAGLHCSVVEIGPGMGRTAYYGHHAGLDYTTIDLPLGMIAQARFLGEAIGPDALWFEGENDILPTRRVKLRVSKSDKSFDIALNVDSLTEMDVTVAVDYMRWLARCTALFLSINHQKNFFTADEAAVYSGSWHRQLCRTCPVWRGYVEEVFTRRGHSLFPGGRFLLRRIVSARMRLYAKGLYWRKKGAPLD